MSIPAVAAAPRTLGGPAVEKIVAAARGGNPLYLREHGDYVEALDIAILGKCGHELTFQFVQDGNMRVTVLYNGQSRIGVIIDTEHC